MPPSTFHFACNTIPSIKFVSLFLSKSIIYLLPYSYLPYLGAHFVRLLAAVEQGLGRPGAPDDRIQTMREIVLNKISWRSILLSFNPSLVEKNDLRAIGYGCKLQWVYIQSVCDSHLLKLVTHIQSRDEVLHHHQLDEARQCARLDT